MAHIIVCAKIIMDPEMPFSVFKVDGEALKPIPPDGVPPVLSTFDESALEAALRIKDEQGCKVTVLTVGAEIPRGVLQKLYAIGADEVVALEATELDNLDPFNTARVLAGAIEKIGAYDLIFMGRQSADWDAGLVWAGVAEALNLPSLTLARKAEISDDTLTVERCVSDGVEVLESSLPALITFTGEVGEMRFASLKAMMMAKKKKALTLSLADIGFESSNIVDLKALYIPEMEATDCHFVDGDNDEEKGRALARVLAEKGLL